MGNEDDDLGREYYESLIFGDDEPPKTGHRTESRIYNKRYHEITDEMDKVLRAFAPNANEPVALILGKDDQATSEILAKQIRLDHEDDATIIRVTNLLPRLRGCFEITFSWTNESSGPNRAWAYVYLLRGGKFTDYDIAKEIYENAPFDAPPIETKDYKELCEFDAGHRHVKGKHYSPEGWKQLKEIVSLVAKSINMEFDPEKVGNGRWK